uniref:Early growth response N-terminal domain-containing protein n=1 Tax=Denticeps clupeoides TaxID=299321 RepID=A0AAY4AYE7_9TELE
MAAAKTEMLLPAMQISDALSFPHSPMDNYPKLEEMMLLNSAGTPFLNASAPEGAAFGTGEPGDGYDHLAGDTLPEISLNCEKPLVEQSYHTQRLPSISYTGRFTLEPAASCGNSLWAEPLFSLVSGLVGINPPSSSTASVAASSAVPQTNSSSSSTSSSSSSSSTASSTTTSSSTSSQSSSLSCSVQGNEPNPIYSAAPTYSSSSPDIFPEQSPNFPTGVGGSLQYPPPSYPKAKTCTSGFPVPMIPDYLFPQQQSEISLVPPDQKPFQGAAGQQPSLTPLSTIKAFATQTGSQDPKSVFTSPLVKPSCMRKYPNRPSKTPPTRAALRLPRGHLRPPLLPLGRADAPHPHPHGPEALPVPHLHAQLQPQRPPDHAHPHAHRREALRLRDLRPQVRPQRRAQAPHQDPPAAEGQEGGQGRGHAGGGRGHVRPLPRLQLPLSHRLLPVPGVLLPLPRPVLLLLACPHLLPVPLHRHHVPLGVRRLRGAGGRQHLQLPRHHAAARHPDHALAKDSRDLLKTLLVPSPSPHLPVKSTFPPVPSVPALARERKKKKRQEASQGRTVQNKRDFSFFFKLLPSRPHFPSLQNEAHETFQTVKTKQPFFSLLLLSSSFLCDRMQRAKGTEGTSRRPTVLSLPRQCRHWLETLDDTHEPCMLYRCHVLYTFLIFGFVSLLCIVLFESTLAIFYK